MAPLADVRTWVTAHKSAAAASALGAAGLGYYVRRRRAAAAAAGGTSSGTTTVGSTTPTALQGGAYDSTANDVYNSLEPQLQSLSASLYQQAAIAQSDQARQAAMAKSLNLQKTRTQAQLAAQLKTIRGQSTTIGKEAQQIKSQQSIIDKYVLKKPAPKPATK
ncbi:MAG: hypothetical protein JWP02_1507 [Acidimicrobiales bacterium]|nr:hypothetical protein [Acidimicrobiales bacterium]